MQKKLLALISMVSFCNSQSMEVNVRKYGIFLLVLGLLSCNGAPRIEFDYPSYNLGDVKMNSEGTHVFTFKNTGSGTLTIKKIQPG